MLIRRAVIEDARNLLLYMYKAGGKHMMELLKRTIWTV